MPRINVVRLFLIIVLTLATHELSASTGVTNVVGGHKPTLANYTNYFGCARRHSFADLVIVCPGTYPEQVVITQPVTLEGVSSANSNQPIIAVPSGGAVANASVFDSFGPDGRQPLGQTDESRPWQPWKTELRCWPRSPGRRWSSTGGTERQIADGGQMDRKGNRGERGTAAERLIVYGRDAARERHRAQ